MAKPIWLTIVSTRSWIVRWAALRWAPNAWRNDSRRPKTAQGKALAGCLGVLVVLIGCSSAVPSAGEAVRTLRPSPITTATRQPTAQPSATFAPTRTSPPPASPTAHAPTATQVIAMTATQPAPPSAEPTQAPLATATLVPAAEATAQTGSAAPVGLTAATVMRVIDGDTVDVAVGGQTVRLRLIGIDTPETKDPRAPVECFGREATHRAEELLASTRRLPGSGSADPRCAD